MPLIRTKNTFTNRAKATDELTLGRQFGVRKCCAKNGVKP